MNPVVRLDSNAGSRRSVPFDQAAADKFFGRATIIAGVVGIGASLLAIILGLLSH